VIDLQGFIAEEWRSIFARATAPPRSMDTSPQSNEAELVTRATEGREARAFLESRTVTDFMAKAEANLTRAMLSQPLEADAQRRNLAVAVQTVRGLMTYMTELAAGGASAERELERLASGKQPRPYF
jgi:hypothetical protein